MELRCSKEYIITTGKSTSTERCCKAYGHDGTCQVNLWRAIKCEVGSHEITITVQER